MPQTKIFPITFWLTLLVAFTPLNVLYFWQLWSLEHYQYFPVLFLAVGMLFAMRWDGVLRLPGSLLAWGLLGGSIVASASAAYYWSPWLACLGFVLLLGGFLSSQHDGISPRWGMLHLWAPCWLLLRLPLNLDIQLTGWLQSSTATVSSHLLDRMGYIHHLAGNVFYLPKGTLFVEAACSGVQSVFSLLFCALLLIAWQRRSPVLLPIYMFAAILWAAIMNIVRVVVIAVAQEQFNTDLAHGWRHETLGYICLALAILLLLSTDRGLRVIFFPVPNEFDGPEANPVRGWWNRSFYNMKGVDEIDLPPGKTLSKTSSTKQAPSKPTSSREKLPEPAMAKPSLRWSQPLSLAVAMLVLGVVLVPQVVAAVRHYNEIRMPVLAEYWESKKELLESVPGVKVISFESTKDSANPTLGVHAQLWACEIDGIPVRVVASQHTEVHDLCNCYKGNGWGILKREKKSLEDWDYIHADFVNSDTVFGSLLFSTVDNRATPIKLSSWSVSDLFRARVADPNAPDQVSFHGVSVNIQLWTVTETALTEQQNEALEKANGRIRQVIRDDLAKATQKN